MLKDQTQVLTFDWHHPRKAVNAYKCSDAQHLAKLASTIHDFSMSLPEMLIQVQLVPSKIRVDLTKVPSSTGAAVQLQQ